VRDEPSKIRTMGRVFLYLALLLALMCLTVPIVLLRQSWVSVTDDGWTFSIGSFIGAFVLTVISLFGSCFALLRIALTLHDYFQPDAPPGNAGYHKNGRSRTLAAIGMGHCALIVFVSVFVIIEGIKHQMPIFSAIGLALTAFTGWAAYRCFRFWRQEKSTKGTGP